MIYHHIMLYHAATFVVGRNVGADLLTVLLSTQTEHLAQARVQLTSGLVLLQRHLLDLAPWWP